MTVDNLDEQTALKPSLCTTQHGIQQVEIKPLWWPRERWTRQIPAQGRMQEKNSQSTIGLQPGILQTMENVAFGFPFRIYVNKKYFQAQE